MRSKHCSGIRQYIKNKPVKFGIKSWVLADSSKCYTSNCYVYAAKNGSIKKENDFGLGYNTVWKLCEWLLGHRYLVYFESLYTIPRLVTVLFEMDTPSCVTIKFNRKGFPGSMKDVKSWAMKVDRREMRWTRDGVSCLAMER